MHILPDLLTFIHLYCFKGIFISVLLILAAKLFFKEKVDTDYAALLLKWLILSYAFLHLLHLIVFLPFLLTEEPQGTFIHRAFGPYFWAYWIMIFFSTFFPLLLWFKKLGNSLYFLLLVAILLNIGGLFESFVSHVTRLHRDFHSPELNPYLPFHGERLTLLYGFLLGIAALAIGNILKTYSSAKR